jgi:hypothetical protein
MNETVAAPLLAFFARDYLIKVRPHPRERSWIEATDESRLANLPSCGSAAEDTTATVTDSTVNTWGETVTGSGNNHVLAYGDGADWTVAAK